MAKLTGKIAWVDNKTLGIKSSKTKGHMVYIRKDHGNTVDLNVITSLEDLDINTKKFKFRNKALRLVKHGEYYSIPINSCDFDHWSAANLYKLENINKKYLKDVGKHKILKSEAKIISIKGNKKRT